MKPNENYSDETYTAIIAVLMNETLRQKILRWVQANIALNVVADRLEQVVYSNLPQIARDNILQDYWTRLLRSSLREVEWDVVVRQISEFNANLDQDDYFQQLPLN